MTPKERAAMQQALEALKKAREMIGYPANMVLYGEELALREALSEPNIEEMTLTQIAARHEQSEQEPVLCVECGKPTMHMGNKCYACCQKDTKDLEDALKSWDAAHVRTKDLTASEIRDIWNSSDNYDVFCVEFARAVISADREKNK